MSLYQKYRPSTLKEYIGNEQVVSDLRPFIKGKHEWPKALLFTGPSGTGKTTLARIIANSMDCGPADICEMDTADFRGIDSIRDIRRQMSLAPISGKNRCWILDECHKLTNDAQNALLKALENPPSHVYFILCTTDPQLLLKTIITRCTTFKLDELAPAELVQVLENVCAGEDADVPGEVLKTIAKGAGGSPRQAISMLERVLARNPDDYENAVESLQTLETQVKDLCQALIQAQKWKQVAGIIKALNEEPETVRRAILGYMNAILLSGKDSARAAYILDCFKEPYFNTGPAGLTLSCYAALMQE